MGIRVAVGLLVIAVLVLLLRGSLFGGDESKPSPARPGPAPTATTPPRPPTRAAGAPTAPSAAGPRTPTPTPRPTTTGGAGTYTVVSGDYPTLIGEKHCVPEAELDAWAQELLDLNGVQATNLQVGQVLELPAGTPPLCVREEEPTPTPTPTSVP